jgi:hypothetical protein
VTDETSSRSGGTPGEEPLHYDYRDAASPSTAVVRAVGSATGRDPLELPVMQDTIDTDALDALVARSGDATTRVSFSYAGVDVVVDGAGGIVVRADEGR